MRDENDTHTPIPSRRSLIVATSLAAGTVAFPSVAKAEGPPLLSTVERAYPELLKPSPVASHERESHTQSGSMGADDGNVKTSRPSVGYAAVTESIDEGISTLKSHSGDTQGLMKATPFGTSVATVISDKNSQSTFSYHLPSGSASGLVETGSGTLVEASNGESHYFGPAEAVDNSGKPVPSFYALDSGVLTQTVSISNEGINFPVVARSDLGYTAEYATQKSASSNEAILKICFNCYFPVAGAPVAFPSPGDLLPLTVAGFNFECRFKSEFEGTGGSWGYTFDATTNHVDGSGSSIVFDFKIIDGSWHLQVSALVVNDFLANNPVYELGAKRTWQDFVDNLDAA